MRGRIWWLWICMSIGAVFCIVLGKSENSFGQTMAIVVVFSIFIQVQTRACCFRNQLFPLRTCGQRCAVCTEWRLLSLRGRQLHMLAKFRETPPTPATAPGC